MSNALPPPFGTLGLKFEQIDVFIQSNGGEDAFMKRPFVKEPLTTLEVMNKFLKPITEQSECSYCELIESEGSKLIGEAQVYICHAWDEIFIDTIKALKRHFIDKPDIIIWFDLFSNNQHILPEKILPIKSHDAFLKQFKKFPYVVLYLSPWIQPLAFSRLWILYELYNVYLAEKKLEICFSHNDEEDNDFITNLIKNPLDYLNVINHNIKVERSECWKKDDKIRLLNDIIIPHFGITKVNNTCNQLIKNWLLTCIDKSIKEDVKVIESGRVSALAIDPLKCEVWDKKLSKVCLLTYIKDSKGIYRYEEALKLSLKICEDYEELKGKSLNLELRWSNTYSQIGLIYMKQLEPDYENALDYYEKCLDVQMKLFGSESLEVGNTYLSLGLLYQEQEHYEKALEFIERDLLIKMKIIGHEDHEDITHAFNAIGSIYCHMNKFKDSIKYYNRTIQLGVKPLGDDHSSIADAYKGLSLVYKLQGDKNKALHYIDKTLLVQEDILGPNHQDVAESWFFMADIYYDKGDYDKALEYFIISLNLRIALLGDDHHQVAETYQGISEVYNCQNNLILCLENIMKVYDIHKHNHGEDSIYVADTYKYIGLVHYKGGNLKETLINFEYCLLIQKKMNKTSENQLKDINIANTLYDIAMVYYSQHNHIKSIEYHEKSIPIKVTVLSKEHVSVANSYHNLGCAYYASNDLEKSMEYYKKSLDIRLKLLGDDHADVAVSYNHIALVYDRIGEYGKSMELFEKARKIQSGTEIKQLSPRPVPVEEVKKTKRKLIGAKKLNC